MTRFAASFLFLAGFCGCSSDRSPSSASIETSESVSDVVAGPVSAEQLRTVVAVIESVPVDDRPTFEPAVENVASDGLRGVDLLAAIRRNYTAALEVDQQAAAWSSNRHLVAACREHGLSMNELARLLTRIGCAHHASETGTEVDIATARAAGEAKILELLPKIDSANDVLKRQSLVQTLETLVAFDAYLTLLDLVPEANRQLVVKHRDELTAILPPTPSMDIRPESIISNAAAPADAAKRTSSPR